MHLIQILLPLSYNDGAPIPDSSFLKIQSTLTSRFGGLTAFSRSPAKGIWKQAGKTLLDDIIVVEVMTETLDLPWWQDFRTQVEIKLHQEEIVIRTHKVQTL